METIQLNGPVDFKGNPADKSKTGGWLAAGLILGCELSEKICIVVLSMSLITYLQGDLHLPSSKSATMVTNFLGSLNIFALFGGFLADAKFGRFFTIVLSTSICALGMALLALATTIHSMKPSPCDNSSGQACIEASARQLAMLYVALYTIALGGGGIKSNVSGFGSDQFDKSNPKEEKAMVYFFNRFYFCVSLGSLFAVTVLLYVQEKLGRGYGISTGSVIVALALLLCGRSSYRYKKPQGSPLTIILRVMFLAWKNRRISYPNHPSLLYGYITSTLPHTEKLRCLDKAAIWGGSNATNEDTNNPPTATNVNEVEEVKLVIGLIPIWSTCILFWTQYSQMNTFTIQQATIMNRTFGRYILPAGSLSSILFVSILIFTFLNERVIVPLARKITRDPKGLRSLQRIGIGLVLSVAGMVAAAITEKRRREMGRDHGTNISCFWLVPQFFFVGAGEACAYVGQLEFFITEAPERMKSLSTGLLLSTLGLGYFVSSFLVWITNAVTHETWLTTNLDYGKLNNFYWMLAVLGVLNFCVFFILAARHNYKSQDGPGNGREEIEAQTVESDENT